MLADSGQLSATDIYDQFHASHPAISQHLKALRTANLELVEKKAQYRIYRINPEPMLELEIWVQKMTRLWDDRFVALDKVLQVEKEKFKKTNAVTKEEN